MLERTQGRSGSVFRARRVLVDLRKADGTLAGVFPGRLLGLDVALERVMCTRENRRETRGVGSGSVERVPLVFQPEPRANLPGQVVGVEVHGRTGGGSLLCLVLMAGLVFVAKALERPFRI